MKRTIITVAASAALAISLACSSPDPEIIVVEKSTETPNQIQQEAPTAQPTIKPTVPRIDFARTPTPTVPPTPTVRPTATKPAPQSATDSTTPTQTEQPPSDGPAHLDSADPVAQLLPENPEFDDSILLSHIYEQMDLDQFALHPSQPISWFQDPNCDYTTPESQQYNYLALSPGQYARCRPVAADLNFEPILGGLPLPDSPEPPAFYTEQTVLNTSPLETIVQHPYRFAFKNTHLYAAHTADPQLIVFAANDSPVIPGIPRQEYADARLTPPARLVGAEYWLNSTWYNAVETEDKNDKLYKVWHPQSLGHEISRHVLAMLEQAAEDANTGLQITHFADGHRRDNHPQILDLRQTITAPQVQAYQEPLVQWEFLSAYLPVIRVTTYAEQHIPFGPPVQRQEFGYEDAPYQYPEPLQPEDVHPTRYAVSFVISLQQIWDGFNDPQRIKYYESSPSSPLPPHQIQRWFATDFMQHRLIGPVVLQVFESDYFEPGIYSRTPNNRTWDTDLSQIPTINGHPHYPKGNVDDYIVNTDDTAQWYTALYHGETALSTANELYKSSFNTEMSMTGLGSFGVSYAIPFTSPCKPQPKWDDEPYCNAAAVHILPKGHQRLFDEAFRFFELPE